jgi:hypothetical protein
LIEEGQKRAFVRGRILWRYQALQVTDFTDWETIKREHWGKAPKL